MHVFQGHNSRAAFSKCDYPGSFFEENQPLNINTKEAMGLMARMGNHISKQEPHQREKKKIVIKSDVLVNLV